MAWAWAVPFLALAAYVFPFTVDDAFITARFARNLALGRGYVMNAGGPWTDGVTGPLWLVPGWIATALGIPVIAFQKGLGVLCTALGAWCVVPRPQGPGKHVYAAMLVTQANLVIWSVAGLETGAAVLAISLLVRGALGRSQRGAWIAAAAVPWLRPELVPAALVLACLVGTEAQGLRRWWAALALVVGLGSVAAFRWVLFGYPLPLALSAKPSDPAMGLRYVALGALVMTGVGGAAIALRAAREGRLHAAVAAAVGVHGLAVVVAGGDWMPGFRLLVPMLPAYAWLVAEGAAARLRQTGPGRLGAVAALFLAVLVPAVDAYVELPRARGAGLGAQDRGRAVASWVHAQGKSVGMVDVGRIPWLTGASVLDLGGVTDAVVARAPGEHLHKSLSVAYLDAHAPDAFLLHSATEPTITSDGAVRNAAPYAVEGDLMASPWFRKHYRATAVLPWADDYYYVAFVRRAAR